MALNDLILRSESHPPLTTKGSELTYAELDGNFIELYDYLSSMNSDSGIAPYDNTATYTGTDYVSYDGNIYQHISPTSTTGVLPDTNPAIWQLTSIGALAHQQNKDSYLAFGSASQVSATDLYDILNNQVINILYDDFITAMNGGLLKINRLYCITNANNYVDTGAYTSSQLKLYIRTISNSKISLKGFISFVAPDYDGYDNYDYTYPYLINDLVAYGLFVYECSNATTNGDTPDNDSSNWNIKSYLSFPNYYAIKFYDVDFNLGNGGINVFKVYDNYNNYFGANDFENGNIVVPNSIRWNDIDSFSTFKSYGLIGGAYVNKLINSSAIITKGGYMTNPMTNNYLNKSFISCDDFILGTIANNNLTNVSLNLTNGNFLGELQNLQISFSEFTSLNVDSETLVNGGYMNEQGSNISVIVDITSTTGIVDLDSILVYNDIYGEFKFDCSGQRIDRLIKSSSFCPIVIKPNTASQSIIIPILAVGGASGDNFISSDYSGDVELFTDTNDYAIIQKVFISGNYFWNVIYINKVL